MAIDRSNRWAIVGVAIGAVLGGYMSRRSGPVTQVVTAFCCAGLTALFGFRFWWVLYEWRLLVALALGLIAYFALS